jgi:subtilase family serine protease
MVPLRRLIALRPAAITLVLSTGVLLTTAGNAVQAMAAPGPRPISGKVSLIPRPVAAAPQVPLGARPIGPVPASWRLDFDIVLRPRDPHGLQALATAVSVSASAEYHHFLRPAQFAVRFGQPQAIVGSVDAALRGVGLVPGPVSANHLVIPVATTVGRARVILHTQFVRYRLVSGRVALANTSAPQLPATAARLTQAVLGLNNLATVTPAAMRPQRDRRQASPASPAVIGPQPCQAAVRAARRNGSWTYNQLARAYSLTGSAAQGREGAGVTIALLEQQPWWASDITEFQACYGTSALVSRVQVDGGAGRGPGRNAEALLDIETVVALAPQAALLVYDAPAADYAKSVIDEYTRIVDDDQAQVLSTSYGLCESAIKLIAPGLIASENTVFEQAAAEGISVFAASGDTGSEGCEQFSSRLKELSVQDPAAQPFVTAVGGTDLTAIGPAPTERVWNEARIGAGAGGGGISNVWRMPSWQAGPGVVNRYSSGRPCHVARGYCREVPDISASADPQRGYVIFYRGRWTAEGGTSAATPLCAALLSDIISGLSSAAREGFLNPLLYSLPKGTFNDIRKGNNDYTRTHHGRYPATRRFDLASGLGSPIATRLAQALRGPGR